MAYVAVVPSIYNAAISGCMAGMLSGTGFLGTVANNYLAISNVAQAVAQQIDTQVGADATLAGGGATVVPASAANANAGESKPLLMAELCKAFFQGKASADVATLDWVTVAQTIKAAYAEAFSQMSLL